MITLDVFFLTEEVLMG